MPGNTVLASQKLSPELRPAPAEGPALMGQGYCHGPERAISFGSTLGSDRARNRNVDDQFDQEPSFDPRSWLGSPRRDAETFDPRAWGTPKPAAPARRGKPARTPPPGRPAWLIPILVGIVIAIAGVVAALLARPSAHLPDRAAAVSPRAAGSATGNAVLESRTLVVPSVADISASLTAVGVAQDQADPAVKAIHTRLGTAPGEIRLDLLLEPTPAGTRLHDVSATREDGFGLQLSTDNRGAFTATPLAAKLTLKFGLVRGELDGESFYSSAVSAGVNDVLVGEFANAFRYDFDMQREVAKGDVFEAAYEQRINAGGEPVGLPVLVYAALQTAAKSRTLYRFRPPGVAEAEWFDSSGRSARRALMRTPIEAARISSNFGMRMHPILGFMRLHAGTDFAAPVGTPIFAAGDGVVLFAGPKGPNGNFVKLRHDNGWETLYLHMNRIWPGIAVGTRVAQGQQIGEVGTTGRSTGPHLHYEVHIDGQPVNPLSIDTGNGHTLTGPALTAFRKLRDRIDTARAAN